MGKDIIIQESGEPKTLSSIDKIITPKVGGGSAEWVLFENLDLMAKTVTKNGTYKAENDNVYGYHKVIVKVPKKGKKKTGKRPQSSGDPNDYTVTRDDDGNLVYTKLPSKIKITTLPTKTGYYSNEEIDISGIVVQAYYVDGGLWGTVPFNELSFSPKRAGETGDIYARNGGTYISSAEVYLGRVKERSFYKKNDGGCIAIWRDGSAVFGRWMSPILFSKTIEASGMIYYNSYTGNACETYGDSFMYQGVKLYANHYDAYQTLDGESPLPICIPDPPYPPSLAQFAEALGIVVNSNEIVVKWNRPDDGKTLTDAFEITVA